MTDREPQPTLTELHAVLPRLTRKGARLVMRLGVDLYDIIYPGERVRPQAGGSMPSRTVALAPVADGLQRGWLAQEASSGVIRLTEAGALASRGGLLSSLVPEAPTSGDAPQKINGGLRPPTRTGTLTPLQRLRHRRDAGGTPAASSAQVEAGERLARDFLSGQMQPRVTANWDRAALGFAADVRAGAAADLSDSAVAAQDRVRRALHDAGPEFAGLLIDVCCLERGLETVESQRSWPPRTARIVLGLALDRLMRHYGIVASGPARSRGPRHWGDVDYRPTTEGT